MTIGIGKFNRSSNFLGPGPKKCRNKSMDFSEFQLVFGSPILFTYVGIEEPSTATISPEKPFSGFVLASTLYISSHLFFLLTWTKPKRGCYYTGARSTWNYFVLLTKKCYYGKWKWPLQNMDFVLHSLSQRNDHVLLRCTIFRFQKLWTVHKMEANPKRIFLKFPVM